LKFLADESCDFGVVRALRKSGHDVLAICEVAKRMDDVEVADLSVREDRVLVTEDKDFGQLVYAHRRAACGVILVRYPALSRRELCADIVKLTEQREEALRNSFVVLQPGRVRITRLPREA
jgi:predicted nuclease of predicted toxin-antitoxin system